MKLHATAANSLQMLGLDHCLVGGGIGLGIGIGIGIRKVPRYLQGFLEKNPPWPGRRVNQANTQRRVLLAKGKGRAATLAFYNKPKRAEDCASEGSSKDATDLESSEPGKRLAGCGFRKGHA